MKSCSNLTEVRIPQILRSSWDESIQILVLEYTQNQAKSKTPYFLVIKIGIASSNNHMTISLIHLLGYHIRISILYSALFFSTYKFKNSYQNWEGLTIWMICKTSVSYSKSFQTTQHKTKTTWWKPTSLLNNSDSSWRSHKNLDTIQSLNMLLIPQSFTLLSTSHHSRTYFISQDQSCLQLKSKNAITFKAFDMFSIHMSLIGHHVDFINLHLDKNNHSRYLASFSQICT